MSRIALVWPNFVDIDEGDFVSSQAGVDLMTETLRELGTTKHERESFVVVPHFVPRGKRPLKAAADEHHEAMATALREFDPDLVLVFGAFAFSYLTGHKVSTWGGRVLEMDLPTIGKRRIAGVLHPDVSAVSQVKAREFRVQLAAAIRDFERDGSAKTKVEIVRRGATLRKRLAKMRGDIAFDYETTGLEILARDFRVRCVGFCNRPGRAIVADLESGDDELVDVVVEWLKSPARKVCHNAKYEIRASMRAFDVVPKNIRHDTMLMHHLVAEDASHRLEMLAYDLTELGGYDTPLKRAIDEGATYADVDMKLLATYCGGDVDATLQIRRKLGDAIDADPAAAGLWRFYRRIVMPAVYTISDVEQAGLHVSKPAVRKLARELGKISRTAIRKLSRMAEVKKTCRRFGVEEFNVRSAQQVAHLLFRVCKLRPKKRTKTGNPSTDGIETMADAHRVVPPLLEAKQALYDLSTLDGYVKRLRPDGHLEGDFYMAGTVTWRLASREPNLQNMPRNGRLKRVFVSRFKGGSIMQADFSQLQVRMLGTVSGDRKIIAAFESGTDFHQQTAATVFSKSFEDVTKEERSAGKTVQFGVIFGIGAKKMALDLGISKDEAQAIIDAYYRRFRGASKWIDAQKRRATLERRVVSIAGQVRRLPEARSRDKMRKWHAQRQAVNFGVQALDSVVTFHTMTTIGRYLRTSGMRSRIVCQVHDSVILDVHPDELVHLGMLLHEVMTHDTKRRFDWIRVPLVADCTFGPSLGEQLYKVTPEGEIEELVE